MKRKILSIVLALALVLGLAGAALASQATVSKELEYANITISLDGKQVKMADAKGNGVEPFAIDGTTYVPLRAVSEALGLYVGWDKATKGIALSTTPIDPDSGINDGTVNFYMVRHGKTILNTLDLVQGWSDAPLTEAGVEVAKNAAVGLSDTVFDYAYSSDLGRAVETAHIILAANKTSSGLDIVKEEGLRENNFGSFEGTPNSYMWGKIAEYHGVASIMDVAKKVGSGDVFSAVPLIDESGTAETHEAVVERLVATTNRIAAEVAAQGGGNVLLTGHGAALGTLIGELTGASAQLDNASVSKIVYKDGTYTAEFVGDMSYVEKGAELRASQEGPVTVYLTRHGKTFFNTMDRVQGWIDSPLTDEGKQVATDLGKGLSGVDFSAVYTSGMGRTVETAELVLAENAASSGLKLIENTGLRETNYGKFEGKLNQEMMAECLKYYGVTDVAKLATETEGVLERYLGFLNKTDDTGAAENLYELRARVGSAFEEVCQEAAANGGGNILVVSHGNAIMALMDDLGVEVTNDIKNASVTKITYQNGAYTVESVGDLSYVEAGAAK